jgi:hypothetical protein
MRPRVYRPAPPPGAIAKAKSQFFVLGSLFLRASREGSAKGIAHVSRRIAERMLGRTGILPVPAGVPPGAIAKVKSQFLVPGSWFFVTFIYACLPATEQPRVLRV